MFFITLLLWRKRELPPGSDAIADFKFQKNVKHHHMSEQSLFRRYAPYKSSHSDQRFNKKHRAFCSVFFITLSRKRKRELPPGSDAIADFKFEKNVKHHHMSEQSLFRRCAPYKSSHSDHIRAIKKILPAKSPILSDFFHTQKPKFECQKP